MGSDYHRGFLAGAVAALIMGAAIDKYEITPDDIAPLDPWLDNATARVLKVWRASK